MPQEIAVETLKHDAFYRGLWVGRSGTGKSTQATNWPPPVLVLDFDRRAGSIRGKKCTAVQFNVDEGYEDVRNYLNNLGDIDPFPYQTVILSSISSIIDFLIHDAKKLLGDLRLEQQKSSDKGTKGFKIGAMNISDMQHHKYVSECVTDLFDYGFLQFPCNVIIEAHIVNAYDSKGNINGTRVLASDKLSEKLPHKLDETWVFEKSEDPFGNEPPQYFIKFHGDLAKTSFRKLPNTKIEITSTNLFNVFQKYTEFYTQIGEKGE